MSTPFIAQLEQHGFTPTEIDALIDMAKPLELPSRHILVDLGDAVE